MLQYEKIREARYIGLESTEIKSKKASVKSCSICSKEDEPGMKMQSREVDILQVIMFIDDFFKKLLN